MEPNRDEFARFLEEKKIFLNDNWRNDKWWNEYCGAVIIVRSLRHIAINPMKISSADVNMMIRPAERKEELQKTQKAAKNLQEILSSDIFINTWGTLLRNEVLNRKDAREKDLSFSWTRFESFKKEIEWFFDQIVKAQEMIPQVKGGRPKDIQLPFLIERLAKLWREVSSIDLRDNYYGPFFSFVQYTCKLAGIQCQSDEALRKAIRNVIPPS